MDAEPTDPHEIDPEQIDAPESDAGDAADGSEESESVPFDAGLDEATLVADARRHHGRGGAMLAAGMLGLDRLLTNKPREQAAVVVETGSEPLDLDLDGLTMQIDEETSVVAPPLPRTPPLQSRARRGRRSR